MNRSFRGVQWVLFGTIVAAGLGVGAAPAGASVCGTAADELLAAEVGLEREWIVQVPFDSAAWRLEHLVVGEDLVVAQSRDGGMTAIQAATVDGAPRAGSVLWSARLGTPGGFSQPAGIGPELVAIARDLDIYALDRGTGRVLWQQPLGSAPDGPATTVGEWVYVPLGGQLERFAVDPLRASRQATVTGKRSARERPVSRSITSNGRVAYPVGGSDDVIFWTTTAGRIVALDRIETGWDRSEFDLGAGPVSQPPVRGRSMFAAVGREAATEPTLVRIDLRPGGVDRLRLGWWTPLPDRPEQGPMLGGDTLVVSLGPAGIAAYSAETGAALWRSCVTGTIVSVGGDRAWVIDETGRLSGLDLASGTAREWLALGCLTVPVVNLASDRLVLASPTGLVVSLAPVNRLPPPAADPAAGATDPADPAAAPAGEDPEATPR
jgi:outer membrane protein assembly factor BamB